MLKRLSALTVPGTRNRSANTNARKTRLAQRIKVPQRHSVYSEFTAPVTQFTSILWAPTGSCPREAIEVGCYRACQLGFIR